MPLFTDGPLSSIEDLAAQDTQLLNVANVEGIDVTQKLTLAQEGLGLEIETLLQSSGTAEQAFWLKPRNTIRNVVATPALKLWHTFRALEMVYRDAYSNQLNDRYAAKRDQFAERANWAYGKVLLLGVGIVNAPIPRATEPQVISAQGNLADGTYYVTIAWANSKGEEGAPSVATSVTTTESTFMVQAGVAAAGVSGWNVYAGNDPTSLTLQNESPLTVGQTWLQPDAVTTTGRAPGCGQSASFMMPVPRMVLRG